VARSARHDRPTTGEPAGRREYPALTGLRIVAALWVVLYHAAFALSGVFERHLEPVWPILRAGWLGVDLFFVLSGFVIANAYLSTLGPRFAVRPVARFLWARFARIWPVWVVVSGLFMVFLLITGAADEPGSGSAPVTLLNTLDQLLMVQQWNSAGIERTSYVVPGWSLSAEWLAYVCFPVAALFLFRLRRLPALVLAAGSVLALVPSAYLTYKVGDATDRWEIRIAGGFLAGVLMGMAVARVRLTARVERIAAGVALAVVVELVIVCWWSIVQQPTSYAGVGVVLFPVLVGALALSRTGLARPLQAPIMQLGGKISYSLYLVHSCALIGFETLAHQFESLAPGSRLYALVLPQVILAAVGFSYLMWRYVEEPSRRWLMAHGPKAGPTGASASATGTPPLSANPSRRPVATMPEPRAAAAVIPTGSRPEQDVLVPGGR
jgi:peptidoglycan/LPS O-acetylase OafA/YrhL